MSRTTSPIAILGPAPPDRGGIARETALLAGELSKRSPVSYFTFSRPYPRWLDPRRFDRGSLLPTVSALPLFDYLSPRSWRNSASTIAQGRPQALIFPWWTAFWGLPLRSLFRRLALLSPGTLRVLLCHNIQDHEGGVLRRFLALGAFSAADAFVVHCEADRESLRKLAPGRPVLRLPHPVVSSEPADRQQARRAVGIERPLVLFLGLLRRYKGVELLLEAAPQIVRETGAEIAVVGEAFPDARGLRDRWLSSSVRDRIRWKEEYVSEEEMAKWLAACDLVVLPYRYVSGSGIAARALAERRPMVASAVGGLKEVVEPGVTGELFEPGDAEGLARAVRSVLSRGFEAYCPGLANAAELASWPRYVDEMLSFLQEIRRP